MNVDPRGSHWPLEVISKNARRTNHKAAGTTRNVTMNCNKYTVHLARPAVSCQHAQRFQVVRTQGTSSSATLPGNQMGARTEASTMSALVCRRCARIGSRRCQLPQNSRDAWLQARVGTTARLQRGCLTGDDAMFFSISSSSFLSTLVCRFVAACARLSRVSWR